MQVMIGRQKTNFISCKLLTLQRKAEGPKAKLKNLGINIATSKKQRYDTDLGM